MKNNKYRLIWFQHFHKAGGTSIVELAKRNGERLYPKNHNGNPVGKDGEIIKLWKFSEEELNDFIDECEALGVSFLSTEWGMPNVFCLASDSRVRLIACIRSPLDRYISNYYFDIYNGFTAARSLTEYTGSRNRTITMFNYYTRVLSGHDNASADVDAMVFKRALYALELIDCCVVLEKGFSRLVAYLGWSESELHLNKTSASIRNVMSMIVHGRFRKLWNRVLFRRKKIPKDFTDQFRKLNKWDYEIYNIVNIDK